MSANTEQEVTPSPATPAGQAEAFNAPRISESRPGSSDSDPVPDDRNAYVNEVLEFYEENELIDDELEEYFRRDFAHWEQPDFKRLADKTRKALLLYLERHGVYIDSGPRRNLSGPKMLSNILNSSFPIPYPAAALATARRNPKFVSCKSEHVTTPEVTTPHHQGPSVKSQGATGGFLHEYDGSQHSDITPTANPRNTREVSTASGSAPVSRALNASALAPQHRPSLHQEGFPGVDNSPQARGREDLYTADDGARRTRFLGDGNRGGTFTSGDTPFLLSL